MGNSKKRNRYSIEFKKEVCEYSNDHNYADTGAKFGIGDFKAISKWRKNLGYPPLGRGTRSAKDSGFKHEVCQYYDNHTWLESCEKFGCTPRSLFRWRRELGYRNKSRGYNLYMESLQPTMQKRQSYDIVMTKMENGNLKGRIAVLEDKLKDATYLLQQVVEDLNGKDLI
tara:strand:+ start:305 stop:814 length:510 start_codon:yes stop_codon:yes gene_type:complete